MILDTWEKGEGEVWWCALASIIWPNQVSARIRQASCDWYIVLQLPLNLRLNHPDCPRDVELQPFNSTIFSFQPPPPTPPCLFQLSPPPLNTQEFRCDPRNFSLCNKISNLEAQDFSTGSGQNDGSFGTTRERG